MAAQCTARESPVGRGVRHAKNKRWHTQRWAKTQHGPDTGDMPPVGRHIKDPMSLVGPPWCTPQLHTARARMRTCNGKQGNEAPPQRCVPHATHPHPTGLALNSDTRALGP